MDLQIVLSIVLLAPWTLWVIFLILVAELQFSTLAGLPFLPATVRI
jgi:hypothetical protein